MRSKLWAITARTPRSRGPFAAQSREDPEPYSFPARTSRGTCSAAYLSDASKIDSCSPSGRWRVNHPSVPGASRFLSRTLAKVPRTITSWLPRREPYELKSLGSTPCAIRYPPAGLVLRIDPAGEMWSVVMLSPRQQSTRAPRMSAIGPGTGGMPSK